MKIRSTQIESKIKAGKLLLPAGLFDGHNVDASEYSHIKTHAQAGYKALHMFTALCAGLHHNLYKAGYGLAVDAFPDKWSPATVKKVLEISTIISICDFVDALTHRKTEIKDGSDKATGGRETRAERHALCKISGR